MTSYYDMPATYGEYNSYTGYQQSSIHNAPTYPPPAQEYQYGWRQDQDGSWSTAQLCGFENASAVPKIDAPEHSSPVHLHAPIPRPAPAMLDSQNYTSSSQLQSMGPAAPVPVMSSLHYDYQNNVSFSTAVQSKPSPTNYDPFADFLANSGTETPLMTFPTPSEMLSNVHGMAPASPSDPASTPSSSSMSTAQSPSSRAYPTTDRTETARTARRRAMAESIGFVPTDPDTISSHEKKRHYLECLERYVLYLHEQIKLVGSQPVPLERVSTYRGLSSRSIRTILVHMENTTRKLNLERIAEEQRFLTLRDTLLQQQAAADALDQLQATSAQLTAGNKSFIGFSTDSVKAETF